MNVPRRIVGKIVELNLSDFFVYGVCTNDLKNEGQVLHLWRDAFPSRLEHPELELASVKFRTYVKFPLRYVLNEPEVNIVGDYKLTQNDKRVPVFRSVGLAGPNEKPTGWWIIDDQIETWVEALTQDMIDFPDDGLHSLGSIKHLYEEDLYPHSPEILDRGPLAFPMPKLQ